MLCVCFNIVTGSCVPHAMCDAISVKNALIVPNASHIAIPLSKQELVDSAPFSSDGTYFEPIYDYINRVVLKIGSGL